VHDHRAVFVTVALIAIPFAAFYPQTPKLLTHLGFEKVSAWMSLGQVAEVFALFAISSMLHRWQLKWIVVMGIFCGVARYVLYATGSAIPVLVGLALHGLAFTFTYVSAQIYLAQRIDAAWQTRAQALLSFASGGVGNLAGYLLTAAWLEVCSSENTVQWEFYWLGLAAMVFAVLLYFSLSYDGGQRNKPAES
jgi:MFS family permease